MDFTEFRSALGQLGVSQLEAAGGEVANNSALGGRQPARGRARNASPACLVSPSRAGVPRRPDSVPIDSEDLSALARRRQPAMVLDGIIKRVAVRGGPKRLWRANLKRCRAIAGSVCVMFKTLANGDFCPASYRRQDNPRTVPATTRWIEEPIAAFAEAVAAAGPAWGIRDCGTEPRRCAHAP